MALSLEQLRSPPSRDVLLQFLIEQLEALGFPATSWQPGSIQRSLLTTFARVFADVTELVKQLVELGANQLASGAALTAFSRSVYDNIRNPATKTRGPFRLASTAAIPYSLTPGQLLVQNPSGIQFTNVTGGVLPAGGVLAVTFEALLAGANGNIAPGSPLALITPLAGVTVTNPAPAGGTWFTSTGQDQESDANLRLRNRTKWATLAIETPRDGVLNIALSASPAVRKVAVNDQNPRGAGTVDVYVSGDLSPLGASDLALVQAKLAARFFGDGNNRVRALTPATVELFVAGVVYFDANFDAAAVRNNVLSAVFNLIAVTPLGGNSFPPGPSHVIAGSDIIAAVEGGRFEPAFLDGCAERPRARPVLGCLKLLEYLARDQDLAI